jgi:transcriptional accessory protein Tex/SPT6
MFTFASTCREWYNRILLKLVQLCPLLKAEIQSVFNSGGWKKLTWRENMSEQEVATAEPITKAQEAEELQSTASSAQSETSADESQENQPVTILNLKPGQRLTGAVKNITDFGAFVDIGLPQDGLVHISELARKKVENVADVVSVGQEVEVWVKKVDQKRGRISLTMIKPISLRLRDIEEDSELEGVVTRLEPYGAFVDIGSVRDGLVHISQITHEYVKHPEEALSVGDTVQVKVLKVNRKKRQIDLSIKALLPLPEEEVEEAPEELPPVVAAVEERSEIEESEEEAMPTAMAMAYAAMQSRHQAEKSQKDTASEKDAEGKRRKELDDIIARTLAANK